MYVCMGMLKMQDLKITDKITGHDFAGYEIDGPNHRELQDMKMQDTKKLSKADISQLKISNCYVNLHTIACCTLDDFKYNALKV